MFIAYSRVAATTLFVCFLVAVMITSVQPAHCADTSSFPDVNLPFISLTERLLPGAAPRTEFILMVPAGGGDNARSGMIVGGLYLDSIVYSKKDDYRSSTTGVGKLYYLPPYSPSSNIYFTPYVTIYRMLGIWYRDGSGVQTDLWTHHWGLVGGQLMVRLGEAWSFHADAETYSYVRVGNNYRFLAGISRAVSQQVSVSAVYERMKWDIEVNKDTVPFQYAGSSESMYMKGIYRFRSEGKLSGVNLFASYGYEHLLNSGNNVVLAPGNIAARGQMLYFGVTLGKASW